LLDFNDYRELVALDVPCPPVVPLSQKSKGQVVRRLLTALRAEGRARLPHVHPKDDRELLRALLTARPPGPLSEPIMLELDRLLTMEARARGEIPHRALRSPVTPEATLRVNECCTVWLGDIRRLAIDAIVNAGNDELLGCSVPFHKCIDNAIHDAAGTRLRMDCARIMGLQGCAEQPGGAKLTRGYNLPAKFVIHTVGPIVWGGLEPSHRLTLGRCYEASLELAVRTGLRSIAFCPISTDLYGFPKAPAAAIAVDTVSRWLAANRRRLDHVVFTVSDSDAFHAYATQSVIGEPAWRMASTYGQVTIPPVNFIDTSS
jgi:O-acetyl-ADP-ribose deacetylase (regulator of RNase III)